jgi:hypothetical protein
MKYIGMPSKETQYVEHSTSQVSKCGQYSVMKNSKVE